MKIKLIDYGYKNKPKRAHYNDSGADVYIKDEITINPHESIKIPLGFGLELPDGLTGFIMPRSSLSAKGIVCELPPIDAGYRGEIHAVVTNMTDKKYTLYALERVGQLVIFPTIYAEFEQGELGENRENGAFGSTGK